MFDWLIPPAPCTCLRTAIPYLLFFVHIALLAIYLMAGCVSRVVCLV